jgi:hypothetical protein
LVETQVVRREGLMETQMDGKKDGGAREGERKAEGRKGERVSWYHQYVYQALDRWNL